MSIFFVYTIGYEQGVKKRPWKYDYYDYINKLNTKFRMKVNTMVREVGKCICLYVV
jgi:hypothetical protein